MLYTYFKNERRQNHKDSFNRKQIEIPKIKMGKIQEEHGKKWKKRERVLE
jgi:hypothetical protein